MHSKFQTSLHGNPRYKIKTIKFNAVCVSGETFVVFISDECIHSINNCLNRTDVLKIESRDSRRYLSYVCNAHINTCHCRKCHVARRRNKSWIQPDIRCESHVSAGMRLTVQFYGLTHHSSRLTHLALMYKKQANELKKTSCNTEIYISNENFDSDDVIRKLIAASVRKFLR